MSATDDRWEAIQDRCASLEAGTELITPLAERPFRISEVAEDRLHIRFDDSHETRTLWPGQFDMLADRLAETPIAVEGLQPGVEPYVTILTLLADYVVEDDTIVYTPEDGGGSPYLRSPAEARTRPERLHDDAVLLADLIERDALADPETLETETLTDLYVLLSDVQHEADQLRQTARDALLGRLGPDQELHGRFGTIRRTVRDRRRLKDTETVLEALDAEDIPREWVIGVDRDKLDIVLAVTDLEESAVYDHDELVYVQKTTVEEEEKYTRLQGLDRRVAELEGAVGDRLREDLQEIERRLEESLS